MTWIIQIIETVAASPFTKLAYLLITAFSAFANWTQSRIVGRLRAELEEKEAKLARLTAAVKDADGEIWNAYGSTPPADHGQRLAANKPIVITISNLKGGVGKSTLTANLGCYFRSLGKSVLLIDLDYQGSLSNTLFAVSGKTQDARTRNASNLFEAGATGNTLLLNVISLESETPKFDFVPTFYEFAQRENRLQVEWLLQDGGDDLRYRLSHVLLNDVVKATYDVILIDTPPRLTTGTINALCASTHFLVPTVLDNTSAEAVQNFLLTVKKNVVPLNPGIRLLGVVGTMTQQQETLHDWEANAVNRIHSEMIWTPKKRVFKRFIPRKAAISRASGYSFAFNDDASVRGWFEALGREIEDEIYGSTDL